MTVSTALVGTCAPNEGQSNTTGCHERRAGYRPPPSWPSSDETQRYLEARCATHNCLQPTAVNGAAPFEKRSKGRGTVQLTAGGQDTTH